MYELIVSSNLSLVVVIFRDLWKEFSDLSTELPVPPQAAGVVGTFNVLFIFNSEHYSHFWTLRMPYYYF